MKVIEELSSLTDQLSGLSNSALGRISASVLIGEETFASNWLRGGNVCYKGFCFGRVGLP